MPILPIDTGRYGSQEMRAVFEEEARLQRMLDVEAALSLAHAGVGEIPRKDARLIARKASTKFVKLSRVREIEERTGHETVAIVQALSDVCGSSGAYVHLGATSSDILDTATALQMKDAIRIIERRLDQLEKVLMRLADRYAAAIMVGRTHGQHALPITLGLKFAVWVREVARHIERLGECQRRVLVGKMSGAVGTMAGLGKHASKIQELVMRRLGLGAPEVTTQILQRDRYAELVCVLANLASSLDKFATEIRNLQRTEIGELAEPFEEREQIGSSTMPQKVNPRISENVSSLAKIARGLVQPALESVSTWHERDLTQSASERFIIPQAFITLDHMLTNMVRVLSGLKVYKDRMRKNLELTGGLEVSEAVMLALARRGMKRQDALRHLRKLALQSMRARLPFREVVAEDRTISRMIGAKEIRRLLDPRNYLGETKRLIAAALARTRAERRARGLA